ncbi:hypothetical protein UFOVP1204_46 [uncultured Caudovirales phage]|uniref:Uncharacterized protein n=1 Tax=uncultured Caudovirales phage TaxID=2100421 RepID=A0A6J5QB02_9CAUD|nr:hypothetical protein UFOVP473_55 [uncultured Caudovirales phage]CAB4176794.1 hypothetical protein UFOVP983_55 [uncultured Caudovirales phage]CAB4190128.1 hypothetical protein UFOVP1204_46 [uncultured Caudovirales phage]
MKQAHSKAPWRVHPVDDCMVIDADGREVAAVDGDYNHPDTWPVMEANVRLIAAAPEMLPALETLLAKYIELVGAVTRYGPENAELIPEVIASRAAIAKATGAAP